jgi:HD-GYP domain-containing protein (c-di-GMP phosphodiesterase class II)
VEKQQIHLRGISPGLAGRLWQGEQLLRLGRLAKLEVVIQDASVSRCHAELAWTERGWVIRDLGSANGTFLNGERVGRAGRLLSPGDILQCGTAQLAIESLRRNGTAQEETPGSHVCIERTLKQGRDEALERLAAPGSDRLLHLAQIGRDFRHIRSFDAFLEWFLYEAAGTVDAQSGCILLRDDNTDYLALQATFGVGRPGNCPIEVSRDLSRRLLAQGESVLCAVTPEGTEPGLSAGGPAPRRSVLAVLLRTPHRRLGVLYLERGALRVPFTENDLHLADAVAATVSPTIDSLRQLLDKERNVLLQTLTALAQMVELRDPYTGGHTQRVTDYTLLLAEELKLSSGDCNVLRLGTPLHDIGKIGIDDAILRKPDRLTPDEFEIMKTHTIRGAELLEGIPGLANLLPIVRSHHERWDGTGYPDGLAGTAIPPLARVVAVADTFDAMTTDRPYRTGLRPAAAFAEIERGIGTQFDPECARGFLRLRPRIEDLLEQRHHVLRTITRGELLQARA